MPEYMVEVDIWWGSGHCNAHHFNVNKLSDIPYYVRRHIIEFTRRYTFDCGDLNRPLNPSIGNIKIVKVAWVKYLSGATKFEQFMEAEKAWVRQLIEEHREFTPYGQYDYTPAPDNVSIMEKR